VYAILFWTRTIKVSDKHQQAEATISNLISVLLNYFTISLIAVCEIAKNLAL